MTSRKSRARRRGAATSGPLVLPEHNALTSSAAILGDSDITKTLVIQPTAWQEEAWQFYHALGELQFAIGVWLSGCVSRCRLIAAEVIPGEPEPRPIDDGPFVDLVGQLAGGVGGQTAMLKKFAVQLSVPGDSYLIGEDTTDGRTWKVKSSSEVRIKRRNPLVYELQEFQGQWRQLPEESLVVRIWWPDDQFSWLAMSPCQAALPIMREVDYYNRYIISILLSRLALNGLLLIPSEATMQTDPRFKDKADPFIAQLVEVASKTIQNPGSASAALPMPLRVPSDTIDKFKHLTFATPIEEKIQEHRTDALKRLATALNMPGEVLTGMGDVNHWGQWQLEESAIKVHISPLVEVICYGLTMGYLAPMAKAGSLEMRGPNGGQVIIWFDPSELTAQPDKSANAVQLYDRGELSGDSLRESSGFEPDDSLGGQGDDDTSDDRFKTAVLRRIAFAGGADALFALSKLTGDETLVPPAPAPVAGAVDEGASGDQNPSSGSSTPPAPATGDQAPPDTRNDQAPSRNGTKAPADTSFLILG